MRTIPFSPEVYQERRKKLKQALGSGRVLLLGNQHSPINFPENHYPFRQDSNFLYYFGIDLPNLIGIIDVDKDQDILFGNEATIDDVIWMGSAPKLRDLALQVGINDVRPRASTISEMTAEIMYCAPYRGEQLVLIGQLTGRKPRKVNKKYSKKLTKTIIAQRQIKSEAERKELDKAADRSYTLHDIILQKTAEGKFERDLLGELSAKVHGEGSSFAYPPIITREGQVLHNHHYHRQLRAGDLLLVDAGMESASGYAGDITRTVPVSGQFTTPQKDIYHIVWNAKKASAKACTTDHTFLDVHHAACRVIIEGLKELNILQGDTEEILDTGAHALLFPHGIGHMIGLDVHDMENLGESLVGYVHKKDRSEQFGLKSLRLAKPIQEGFAVTIEPGIYFIPQLIEQMKGKKEYQNFYNFQELNKWLDFGGIRLEDDYYVTGQGAEILGAQQSPIAPDDIIEAMRQG